MAANTTGAVVFNPEELGKNFIKWRKELLTVPVDTLKATFNGCFAVHTGIRHKEKVGILMGDMQIGPYDPKYRDTNDITIAERELEVFLGNAVKGFDPNTAIQSIWDEYVAKGAQGAGIPFVKYVGAYLMGKVGENLAMHVWDGKRNGAGHSTVDLCDGIETIIDKEIKAGAIATSEKNLVKIDALTAENAEEVLKDFYWSADKKLRAMNLDLHLTDTEYRAYCDAYQMNHGALPYNKEYDKVFLEGSRGKCRLVVDNYNADSFLKLTPSKNFIFGTNVQGEETKLLIEKSLDSHFMYDYICTMFAGYQVGRIEKEFLLIGKTEAGINTAKNAGTQQGEGA